MSTFHDELVGLTDGQPLQPIDRLQAVTGKARRIRRRRAAASGLAVVALGGVGAGVVQINKPTPQHYTATPVTSWADRSQPTAKDLAFGAFTAWYGTVNPSDDPKLRWLYRGVVSLPDGTQEVVADFIATKDNVTALVTASIERTQLDDNGAVLDPDHGWYVGDSVDLATLSTPPTHVDNVLPIVDGTVVVTLESPSARQTSWSVDPLPFAPTDLGGAASGANHSDDGVFTTVVAKQTGPLTLQDPRGRSRVISPVNLAQPTPLGEGANLDASAGGTTHENTENHTWSGSSGAFPDAGDVSRSVRVLCYGGGRMTVTIHAFSGTETRQLLASGSAACDGAAHQAVSAVIHGTGYVVDVTSDRLQGYSYQVVQD